MYISQIGVEYVCCLVREIGVFVFYGFYILYFFINNRLELKLVKKSLRFGWNIGIIFS